VVNNESLIPVAVAYFTVRVRANYKEDARHVVEAYLYSGAEVVRADLDTTDFNYAVLVRTESCQSAHELGQRVQYQRDRLASGLYFSTEPRFLGLVATAG
jgi:hypothetical protein